MRFAEAVKLLAAPASVQAGFLRDVPENAAVPGFRPHNDVYRVAILYLDSTAVQEGAGGTEGETHWRARTQIPAGASLPTEWLSTALRLLVESGRPFLFTRHGLRSAPEWRLIRHLAGQVCDAMGWPRGLTYPDFASLWNDLGDGAVGWDDRSEGPV